MKKTFMLICIVVLIIAGVIVMGRGRGIADEIKDFQFETYTSKDPYLNISLEYLAGWQPRETRGSYGSYAEVQFLEPQRQDKHFAASMVALAQKASEAKFSPLTLEGMVDDFIAKRLKLKDAQLLSSSPTEILDLEATKIILSYQVLDKFDQLDAKFVPATERIVAFKKGDTFYTLRYINTTDEFDKFDAAFTHCLQSLRFIADN